MRVVKLVVVNRSIHALWVLLDARSSVSLPAKRKSMRSHASLKKRLMESTVSKDGNGSDSGRVDQKPNI
jgi:hypothetical protein